MENLNANQNASSIQGKENANQSSSAKGKKSPAKKSPSKGNANQKSKEIQKNIESLLRDIPRGGRGSNSPSLYKIDQSKWDAMGDRERKEYRRKMRSKLEKFKNDLLGRDRSDKERKDAKKEFLLHFKENYQSSDLNSHAIYSGNNSHKRKEFEDMIKIINLI